MVIYDEKFRFINLNSNAKKFDEDMNIIFEFYLEACALQWNKNRMAWIVYEWAKAKIKSEIFKN